MITEDYINRALEREKVLLRDQAHHEHELYEIRTLLRELKENSICEKWSVEVGSIVKDRKGLLHKVSKVEVSSYDTISYYLRNKPWLVGNPLRKDGTYGTAERNLYGDWELVQGVA
jgi:hypothetical protein